MTNNTRIIKAAADFLSDIARVSRMSKENCQVADNHAQELYSLLVRPEPKQEPTWDKNEPLCYSDICQLSQLFNQVSTLTSSQELRINEWLKRQIAITLLKEQKQ